MSRQQAQRAEAPVPEPRRCVPLWMSWGRSAGPEQGPVTGISQLAASATKSLAALVLRVDGAKCFKFAATFSEGGGKKVTALAERLGIGDVRLFAPFRLLPPLRQSPPLSFLTPKADLLRDLSERGLCLEVERHLDAWDLLAEAFG